ncbi:MAG: alpha/beta fold hydrolase [Pannonibacter phragmitetus]
MSAPAATSFTGAEGNRLAADRFGSGAGQPVLLLHGGGQTRHAWAGAGVRLAKAGFTAYAMDQRGHGDSEWVASAAYDFADFGRDLSAVAAQVTESHGRRPVLVGASLGGLAGLLSEGAQTPGRLEAMVLVDITPRVDAGGVSRILDFMAEKVDEGFATVEDAADAIAAYLPHRPRPRSLDGLAKNLRLHPDGRYRWHWDPAFIAARHAGGEDLRTKVEAELVAAAARLTLPVLLVRGGQSELVSQEHLDEFRQLVPHARLADVAGAGHMVAGDRNDVFTGALLEFLQDLAVDAKA